MEVKRGHINRGMIGELVGTLNRENATMVIFVTLEPPTSDMNREALSAGFYSSMYFEKDYPSIQALTIEKLLNGVQVQMPSVQVTFKKAEKVKNVEGNQDELGI